MTGNPAALDLLYAVRRERTSRRGHRFLLIGARQSSRRRRYSTLSSGILWNTVRYQAALCGLRAEGYPVNEEDLAHLSPTRYAHVNPYGRYRFDLGGNRVRGPGAGPEQAEPRPPGTLF